MPAVSAPHSGPCRAPRGSSAAQFQGRAGVVAGLQVAQRGLLRCGDQAVAAGYFALECMLDDQVKPVLGADGTDTGDVPCWPVAPYWGPWLPPVRMPAWAAIPRLRSPSSLTSAASWSAVPRSERGPRSPPARGVAPASWSSRCALAVAPVTGRGAAPCPPERSASGPRR